MPTVEDTAQKFPGQPKLSHMNGVKRLVAGRAPVLVLAVASLFMTNLLVSAQEVQHLSITQPGGMPGKPVMTGISHATNEVTVTWDGPAGYYQLYQKLGLTNQTWKKVGGPNLNRIANVINSHSNAFFRVSGPSPQYAGSQACLECHANIHALEQKTRHAHALETLKLVHQNNNPSCLPCHTVGYGLPTGFISGTATPQLAGVQCENCHGPAGHHAANENDLTVRPRADIAGQVCGGCHTGAQHPTYEEWKISGHFAVVEDMNPPERISRCGQCHSGTARLALVNGLDPSNTITNDANVGITCVVCHDPHQNHVWTNVLTGVVATNQLRYPVASTNYYSVATSAPFTNRYDINVCAQCHNDRGASWTTTSRPPHHSPQYNMLLGTVGVRADGSTGTTNAQPASHATLIEKQCVSCHMPKAEYESETHPAVTGHSFKVESYAICQTCHPGEGIPQRLVKFTQDFVIKPRIQQVKADLDLWATTKAPLDLRTKYGPLAWEYTEPGDLSTGIAGPNTAEQAQIPKNIKLARFNLYVVTYDGSFGVHNALYGLNLLDTARNWVQEELNK